MQALQANVAAGRHSFLRQQHPALQSPHQQRTQRCTALPRIQASSTSGQRSWATTAARLAAVAPTPHSAVPLLVLERSCAVASLSSDKQSAHERQQRQEYLCNFGSALRTIQKDLPALLHQAPDLSIYAENVQFVDNLSPRLGLGFPAYSCSGKEAYSRLLWSLRFHQTLFFGRARLELLRMWEREPGVICVRWSARACPRLLDSAAAPLTLDGVSEFSFNDQGRISKHSVDCVSFSGPRVQVPLLARYARPQMVPGLAGSGSGSWDE
ncbi:hypothetical protein ACK3TF_005176 [Chlorella vulgaris]